MTDSTTAIGQRSDWLTRKEAAGYLRLGESTLAKLFRERIPLEKLLLDEWNLFYQ